MYMTWGYYLSKEFQIIHTQFGIGLGGGCAKWRFLTRKLYGESCVYIHLSISTPSLSNSQFHYASLGYCCSLLDQSSQVAITNSHKLGGLKQNLFSIIWRGQKLGIKVPSGLAPCEGSEGEAVPPRSAGFRWWQANLHISWFVDTSLSVSPLLISTLLMAFRACSKSEMIPFWDP